jgi:hypothetical protein
MVHQRIQNKPKTKEILLIQATLALYSTFNLPFFIILTSIPSTKVLFLRVTGLQKGFKKKGERIKKKQME